MNRADTWDSCALEYDSTAEKVTGPCIVKLLEQVGLLPVTSSAKAMKVIDVAGGPGILGTLVGEAYSEAGHLDKVVVLSTDFSSNMVKMAEQRFVSRNWSSSQFSARTIDAQDLADVPSDHYTHAFCTFGIMMVPNSEKALNEMFRVLQPSGTIGITTWHKVGWMPIVTEAVVRAKASSANKKDITAPLSALRDWTETSYVQKVLEDAHFENIVVNIFETPLSYKNQDDCVKQLTKDMWIQPILKATNMTDEQRDRYNQVIHQALLDMISKEPNQPFALPMVAIIAHGQKSVK